MPAKPPGNGASEAKAARPCPICGKPSTQENHPFCSPRCRDVDLNRWLSGSYMIPGRDNDEDQDD